MSACRYRYLSAAAACLVAVAGPAGAAYAASGHPAAAKPKPVLSIRRVDGPAVAKTNKLVAPLALGNDVVLTIGSISADCTSASITARVAANPSSTGKAALTITRAPVSHCTVGTSGITITKLSASNLSYPAVVSTAKGDPVTISEKSTSAPITFTADINVTGIGALTCVFTASSYTGRLSNLHNRLEFSDQSFSLDTAASSALCSAAGTTATLAAKYGPLRDESVKFSPRVFVN